MPDHNSLSGLEELPRTVLDPPSITQISPPTVTRVQSLPFEDLTWENFERLCVRLLRAESDVLGCRRYGLRGQKQDGIDIMAWSKNAQGRIVCECKRRERTPPASILSAVDKFREGQWIDGTKRFILCTRQTLHTTKQVQAIDTCRTSLKQKGVEFEPWDGSELFERLRHHPELIDDFFGRTWAKEVCGEDAVAQLSTRLCHEDYLRLRERLLSIYRGLFAIQQRGLTARSGTQDCPESIEKWYVIPDILPPVYAIQRQDDRAAGNLRPRQRSQTERIADTQDSGNQLFGTYSAFGGIEQRGADVARESVFSWLPRNSKSVILGEAGSGKSSLLQYLTLGVLDSALPIGVAAHAWADLIPVWIPFEHFCDRISCDEDLSIPKYIGNWLAAHGEQGVWQLMEKALSDRRLLVCVDGLDEWKSEQAAIAAWRRIQMFASTHQCTIVTTSRKTGGYTRLGTGTGWSEADLASLSQSQQMALVQKRIGRWMSDQEVESSGLANLRAGQLLSELSDSRELSQLAANPLLLTILTLYWLDDATLPTSRFEAYERVVEHFITKRPKERAAASGTVVDLKPKLSCQELTSCIARLAFQRMKAGRSASFSENATLESIRDYARETLEIGSSKLRELAVYVLENDLRRTGLLVEGETEGVFTFFHRAIQEALASMHASELPLRAQIELVKEHCLDSTWRETLLGIVSRQLRGEDADQLVEAVREVQCGASVVSRLLANDLLYEMVLANPRISVGLSECLMKECLGAVRSHLHSGLRTSALHTSLRALDSRKLRGIVAEAICEWLPSRPVWRASVIRAMSQWPEERETEECLLRALLDEDRYVQRSAAVTLAELCGPNAKIGSRIGDLLHEADDPGAAAACLEALWNGWPESLDLEERLEANRDAISPDLRFSAITGRVFRHEQTEDDLDRVLALSQWGSGIDTAWRNSIVPVLLSGWGSSSALKSACLRSLEADARVPLDRDAAILVLLKGFPDDRDVVAQIAREFRDQEYPMSGLDYVDVWRAFRDGFRGSSALVPAVDEYVAKKQEEGALIMAPELAALAMVGKREKDMRLLLDSLSEGSTPHWLVESLLEAWGMDKPEVGSALRSLVLGNAKAASRVGYLIPRILPDPAEAASRLVELLHDPLSSRPSFVLAGIHEVREQICVDEVVDAVLDQVLEREYGAPEREGILRVLIEKFFDNPRVRDVALRQLEVRAGDVAAVARAYKDDETIRDRVRNMVTPLAATYRESVIERLSRLPPDSPEANESLRLYDSENDPALKTKMSIAYCARAALLEKEREKAIEVTSDGIVCYGMDYQTRRQAAFCGLAQLDRLDIFLAAKERMGKGEPARVSLVTGFPPNEPLAEFCGNNWGKLRVRLQDEFWSRVTMFSGSIADVWDLLAPWAHRDEEAQLELQEFLAGLPNSRLTPRMLGFLDRTQPNSRRVRDACIEKLRKNGMGSLHKISEARELCRILVSRYRDEESLEELTRRSLGNMAPGVLIALCESWPNCERSKAEFTAQRDELEEYFPSLAAVLSTHLDEVNPAAASASRLLNAPRLVSLEAFGPFLLPALERRLRQSDDWVERAESACVCGKASPSEAIVYSGLLLRTGRAGPEFMDWCKAELEAILKHDRPWEFGFDLRQGRLRPVAHGLLDVVLATR